MSSKFVESLGLRPLDAGPLAMARALENDGLLSGPDDPLRQAQQFRNRRQPSRLSAPVASPPHTHKDSHMRVFVTGGTGHSGPLSSPNSSPPATRSPLARSDAAAAVSALGAKVRRGSLEDLDGLKEAAADSDGVIHVAHRQDLLPSGGIDAVAAAEFRSCSRTARRSREPESRWSRRAASARPGTWAGRPPRRTRPFPAAMSTRAPCGFVTSWNRRGRPRRAGSAVFDRAASPMRTARLMCRLPARADRAREGEWLRRLPRGRRNLWGAVHIRDVATLFRLALEKGPAGRYWHAIQDEGIPFREIAEAIGSRLDLPAMSIPRTY